MLSDSSVTVDEGLDIRDAFRPFKDPMYWYVLLSVKESSSAQRRQALGTDLSIIWRAAGQCKQLPASDRGEPGLFDNQNEFAHGGPEYRRDCRIAHANLLFGLFS